MFRQWMRSALIGIALAWTAPALAAEVEQPAGPAEPPDEMRSLSLTDLQRKILGEILHRHVFESPPPPAADARFGVKVEPTVPGGLYRMGSEGDLPVRLTVMVGLRGAPVQISLRYWAEDFYGRKVADGALPPIFPDANGVAAADLAIKELNAVGYYHIIVTAVCESQTAVGTCGIAVVYPPAAEPDAKSPFGVMAPPGALIGDLPELCRRLGASYISLDWADGRHIGNLDAVKASADAQPQFRWAAGDAALEAIRKRGLVPTGIVPFGAPGQPEAPVPAPLVGATVLHFVPMIQDWQLGRSPALPADSLGPSAAAYRGSMSAALEAIKRVQAPVGVFAAASPEILVDVLTEGPALAGTDGVSLWIDASASAPNLRSGAYRRTLDYCIQTARRAGVKRAVVAQTGEDPAAASPQQQAWKLVTRHVLSLAAGAERVYVTAGHGIPEPLPTAAAYAWMAHILSGARYEGNAWGDVPLLESHLFAGPERRVAVVWSWIGDDAANPAAGALVFDDGSGLDASDVVGHRIGIWKNARLIVPLGEAPIYISAAELKTDQLRERLRLARIIGIPPASIWVSNLAITDPTRMTASLWVQSHRPNRTDVLAGLLMPAGLRARQTKYRFSLDPGQAREVTVEIDAVKLAAEDEKPAALESVAGPPYEIQAVASLGEEWVRRIQPVWPTQAPERTIEVGYGLTGWEGIAPVVVQNEAGDVKAEVRTAWDSKFFYFSAVVHRTRDTFRPGRFASDGDAIQLAWGAADRADDDFGGKARDRSLPVGAFRDTDHLMAVTFMKDGPQIIRLRGPKVALRDHIPGNQDAWYGPVEGATADIARDAPAKATYFAAAIPWQALPPLSGGRGKSFRFGFRIGDGANAPLEWSRAACVPDFLAGPGSFLPISRTDGLPCQTRWTLMGK